MESILDILQDIHNLHTVPCYIKIIEYYEMIGETRIEKVAIYDIRYKNEIKSAKNYEFCEHCVVLFKKQYDALFKPLFKDIGLINKEVRALQEKIK